VNFFCKKVLVPGIKEPLHATEIDRRHY